MTESESIYALTDCERVGEAIIIFGSLIVAIVVIVRHGVFTQIDLTTKKGQKEAAAQAEGEVKAKIVRVYRKVAILIMVQLLFQTLFQIAMALIFLSREAILGGEAMCRVGLSLGVFGVLATACIYVVFEFQLDLLYARMQCLPKPPHHSPLSKRVVLVFITGYAVVLSIWTLEGNETISHGIFPEWEDTGLGCDYIPSVEFLFIYVTFSFVVQIAYVMRFLKAYQHLIIRVGANVTDQLVKINAQKKLAADGFKQLVLSFAMALGNAINMAIFATFNLPTPSINFVFASLCLIFDTYYYQDSLYFRRLCGPCLFVCDRKCVTKVLEKVGYHQFAATLLQFNQLYDGAASGNSSKSGKSQVPPSPTGAQNLMDNSYQKKYPAYTYFRHRTNASYAEWEPSRSAVYDALSALKDGGDNTYEDPERQISVDKSKEAESPAPSDDEKDKESNKNSGSAAAQLADFQE